MEEVPILNVRLHQKYLPNRVVSGRRCQLFVIDKLTAPKQTNICLPDVVIDYLRLQITDI